MSYDIDDIIGDMPMHYTYFRKERGCRIPYRAFGHCEF